MPETNTGASCDAGVPSQPLVARGLPRDELAAGLGDQAQRVDPRQHAVDVAVAVAGAELAGADLAQHRAGFAAHLVGGHPLGRARVLEHDRLAVGAGAAEFGRAGARHRDWRALQARRARGRRSPARIAARRRLGVTGTSRMRTPVAAWIAFEDRRRRRHQRRLADALGAPRPERLRVLDQVHRDRRHVADGRDQVVVQVVGAAVDVLLHQRHADALGDAAVDLAFDLGRVDRPADVVRGVDVQQRHRAELEVDLDLGDLRREAVGRVRHALAVGVERHGRRIEVAAADEQVACASRLQSPRRADAASARRSSAALARRRARPTRRVAVERERDVGIGVGAEAEPLDQLPAQLAARAARAALPETKVWRDADDLPASAVRSVSPITCSTHASGRPTASANICGMIVAVPWPISCAPL